MTTGPCLGCGLSLDGSGNLGITGVTDREWPYTAPGHLNPDGWYCDTGTDGVKRLWHKPWNLPWGILAHSQQAGLGVYANGLGPQSVTPIAIPFLKDRITLVTGVFAYQCDVATLFEQSNPYRGARAGGVIWDATAGTDIDGQTFVSPVAGYTNVISLSAMVVNDTGASFTRTWEWRTFAVGLINCRPLNYYQTYLMAQDVGPRL